MKEPRRYIIYSIPYEMRGSEYLNLVEKSIEEKELNGSSFKVAKFSWKGLLLKSCPSGTRRLIQIHWETNVYGSKYTLVSMVRMLYRFPGLFLAKLRGAKIIWIIHNLHGHDYPHPKIDSIGRSIMWCITDAVVAQQQKFAGEMQALHPSKTIHYIPHGNFVGVFGPLWQGDKKEARIKYGLNPDSTVLLAFGSIRPYKELPKLVEAVTEARKKGADVTLFIVGKASKEYAKVITEKVAGNPSMVLKLGFVENHEVPEIMATADYSALYYGDSSLNSAQHIQSLSYGVPVIVRDMPAAEIIQSGENGFVFESEFDLIDLLLKLRDMRTQNRDDIIKTSGPDWPTVGAKLRQAYTELWAE